MKNITVLLVLAFSVNVFAGTFQEFDEAQEVKCYQELKTLGCVSGEEENLSCSEKKKMQMTKDCQKMHAAKKLNK